VSEAEVRAALEKALRGRITWAEWQHLKATELVAEYLRDSLPWQEFRDFAAKELRQVRRFYQNQQREESGDISAEEMEVEEIEVAPDQRPDTPKLSDRTFARSQALGALNRLRTGGRSAGMSALHGALMPRGGLDGTLAQWVYLLAVELWVPAEEVANHYRSIQKTMSAESNPPKTSERAFQVAAFVRDNITADGTRAPWPDLCERWNQWPLTEPFDDWRHFHKTFLRGAKATPPRYVASNGQIANQVRSGGQEILDVWAEKVRG
jgi:hypothetical protein